MADIPQSSDSAPSTPKKGGRPPKVKGARKCSQATAAIRKRASDQKQRLEGKEKQRADEEMISGVSMSTANQVENMEVDAIDDNPVADGLESARMDCETLPMDSLTINECEDSDTKPGNYSSTKGPDGDQTDEQSRTTQKRKIPSRPVIASPSPVPKKRNTYEDDIIGVEGDMQPLNLLPPSDSTQAQDGAAMNESFDLLTLEEIEAAIKSVKPPVSDNACQSESSQFESPLTAIRDPDVLQDLVASDIDWSGSEGEGLASDEDAEPCTIVDLEIDLKKGICADEGEEPEVICIDDNPLPVFHTDPDENYNPDSTDLLFDRGAACTDRALTFPDPVYRSDTEIIAFLTMMAMFAVKYAQKWFGIGILDSMIADVANYRTHPARNYMRGYYEHPELILHPAFSSPGKPKTLQEASNRIGHWYLIAFNVKANEVTIYDSLINPRDEFADIDPRYMETCHDVAEYLLEWKYIDVMPKYVRFAPGSYNKQVDGTNCGVHVARIAEQIAFTGTTTELHPFHIRDECHRMLETCRKIHFDSGWLKEWPETLQNAAYSLPQINETPTRMLIQESVSKNKGKKEAKAKPTCQCVPSKSTNPSAPSEVRRSTRAATQKVAQEIDKLVFEEEQLRNAKTAKKKGVAIGRNSANVLPYPCNFGEMSKLCPFRCNALLFKNEPPNRCCGFGTIPVEAFKKYPTEMENVFKDPEFLEHMRAFNTMMAMVAVSSNIQRQMDVFLVCGEFKYCVGDIFPDKDNLPRFEQNYIYDPDTAIENRQSDAARFNIDPVHNCDQAILRTLEKVIRRYHPLAAEYACTADEYRKRVALAKSEGREVDRYYLVWQPREESVETFDGNHSGQYTKPAAQNTVFRLWKSDGSDVPRKSLMIAVNKGDGKKREIPFFSAQIDPAAYPLIFIYGEQGWRPEMPKCDPADRGLSSSSSRKPKQTDSTTRPSRKAKNDDDVDSEYREQRAAPSTVLPRRTTRQSQITVPSSQPSTTDSCPPMKPPMLPPISLDVEDDGDTDDDDLPRTNPYISMRGFCMSRTYDRTQREKNIFHPITGCRKLTSVYLTDVFLRCERQKLDKLEAIQEHLERRADRFNKLRKTLELLMEKDPKLKGKKLGRIIKLSRTLRGSPADMRNRYHNAVAINVRVGKGRSDLFITFTGNPKWPEIQNNLRKHYNPPEKWTDRPDLVNRVFLLYAKEFLHDILVVGVLGKIVAYNYSVEHQKRGMPHLHVLAVVDPQDRKRLSTAHGLDDLISAELPEYPDEDGTERTRLLRSYREQVEARYIHHPGRCVQFCGMNRKHPDLCNKRYPKPFSEVTVANGSGYAELKRPDNGRQIPSKWKGKPLPLTNQYVVPHNRYLVLKYNCHINVENVHNVRSVKYLYKYSFKGHDRGFVKPVKSIGAGIDPDVVDYNEISHYRSSRVLGAAEADMRLRTGLPVTKCSHTVEVLPIHLPAQHVVTFYDGSSESQLAALTQNDGVSEGSTPVSQLTAYFSIARAEAQIDGFRDDPSRACNLRYVKMPEHYTWHLKKGWKRRIVNRKVIGRLVTVYPSDRERYSLRELLSHCAGVKSYEDLRTVKGTLYDTFEAAAYAMELFLDDRHFQSTMSEAISVLMPNRCRLTFALLIVFNKPEDPAAMLARFLPDLIDKRPDTLPLAVRERRAIAHIASILHHHGIVMSDVNLPAVTDVELEHAIAEDYVDEEYERDADGSKAYDHLNDEQKAFVDRVSASVEDPLKHRLFFLQGSGGTGKTFVYNTLIRRLRHQGRRVLAVASTGVAAIMLHGGQTVHSAFRLPIDFEELRSLSAQDVKAVVAAGIDVLIWDEAPMQHNLILRTVDYMLRDFTGNKLRPFGGKIVVLGGDFKQLLPVIPGGKIADAFAASLLCCETFTENFAVFTLTQNMRALKDPEYASWLHQVGCGAERTLDTRPGREGRIVLTLPQEIVTRSKKEAIEFVYPRDIFDPNMAIEEYQERVEKSAIVASTNAFVDLYNALVVSKLPTPARRYKATNWLYKTAQTEDDELRPIMPTEVMEVFEKSGFAMQNLVLKERAVVMLTRNLCVRSGLCNGTRMVILSMKDNIILCRVITGPMSGANFAVPKVEYVHDDAKDDTFPPFVRLQFPLRPAFAVTINKSQGQTLSRVAIMLDKQCFTHGQLYVALSRAGSSEDVRVFLPSHDVVREGGKWIGLAHNIVYRQVLSAVESNMKQLFVSVP